MFASRVLRFHISAPLLSGRVQKPFKWTPTRAKTLKERAKKIAEVDAFLRKYRISKKQRVIEPAAATGGISSSS